MNDTDEAAATFNLAARVVEKAFSAGGKISIRDDARDQESTELVQASLRKMIQTDGVLLIP